MFVVVPARCVSREQGGCLSSSLLLSMFLDLKQDSRRSSYVIVMSMMEYSFVTLTTFGLCLPTQSKDKQD